MLVKRSSKNQIALPKSVLERAGIGENDLYFDVEYENGRIVLTPMQLEEKIPPEVLARFEERTLKREPGDKSYSSMDEAVRGLRRRKSSR